MINTMKSLLALCLFYSAASVSTAETPIKHTSFRPGEIWTDNNGAHINAHGGGIFCEIDPATGVIMTDGLDEHGNSYLCHPMTGVPFRGEVIPQWEEVRAFCRSAAQTLPCLRVVGWDVAILPGGKLELIEGNHNPGMNIVQAPAKHGVHDKFAHMLLDFYGDPAQYACETVKQP